MKQSAFDNILKVASLLMIGYFLFLMTKMSKPPEANEGGRYRFIDKNNGYILDSKTGYLYEYERQIKN